MSKRVTPWTQAEDDYCVEKLGAAAAKRRRRFSPESIEYLEQNIKEKRVADIARDLGFGYQTVYNKARDLGLLSGLKRVSEWRTSLIALDDIAIPLFEAGVRLEICEKDKKLAVYATRSLEEVEVTSE